MYCCFTRAGSWHQIDLCVLSGTEIGLGCSLHFQVLCYSFLMRVKQVQNSRDGNGNAGAGWATECATGEGSELAGETSAVDTRSAQTVPALEWTARSPFERREAFSLQKTESENIRLKAHGNSCLAPWFQSRS